MSLELTADPADTAIGPAVFRTIGALTRQLHDCLNELGYAEQLRGTVGRLPDAKSRLAYIARLTGEAAEKVLGSVESAKAEQARIALGLDALATRLGADAAGAGEVAGVVAAMREGGERIDAHLTEIMMAQDFHDLTGQVIARVVQLAAVIEEQLVQLLLQAAPGGNPAADPGELGGPVVDPKSQPDVVTDQTQVDALLASMGF